jgi:hypothetical protein
VSRAAKEKGTSKKKGRGLSALQSLKIAAKGHFQKGKRSPKGVSSKRTFARVRPFLAQHAPKQHGDACVQGNIANAHNASSDSVVKRSYVPLFQAALASFPLSIIAPSPRANHGDSKSIVIAVRSVHIKTANQSMLDFDDLVIEPSGIGQ